MSSHIRCQDCSKPATCFYKIGIAFYDRGKPSIGVKIGATYFAQCNVCERSRAPNVTSRQSCTEEEYVVGKIMES